MKDHRNTLNLVFENGFLPQPRKGERWTMLNAATLPDCEIEWASVLHCQQGFRPTYLELENAGYSVKPTLGVDCENDGVVILAARARAINELNFAKAWNATKPGGFILFSGAKSSGVQPLRKWVGKTTSVAGSLSKHHAVAFWVQRTDAEWPIPEMVVPQSDYHVEPGMFSASGADKGSRLLIEQFGPHIRGHVADFGAGWGYLSAELLKRSDKIDQVDLYEADWNSLEAAKQNVTGPARFHWCDMMREAPRIPFNWIIMNPPFHSGRAAEPKLGLTFIEAAAKSLPSGGHLLMVANTNLPYEETLNRLFRKVERKAQANGFKVIEAVR